MNEYNIYIRFLTHFWFNKLKGWWNDRKETLIALLKGKKPVKQEISLLVEKRVGKRVISSVIGRANPAGEDKRHSREEQAGIKSRNRKYF